MVSKPCILVNYLKQRSYIAIRKIILKWSFLILNTILYFLMLINIWQFHLSLTRNGSRMNHLRFCLHRITLSEHFYSYTSLILLIVSNVTCILLSVPMFDQNQMYPSSISPIEKFQGTSNFERLKGRALEPWITGWT